jgi:HSP20 family molecular chaperone IbpA
LAVAVLENVKDVKEEGLEVIRTLTTYLENLMHKAIEVPEDIDVESVRSNYNNGILEITFKKKEQQKPKGRQINVE